MFLVNRGNDGDVEFDEYEISDCESEITETYIDLNLEAMYMY